MADKIKLNIPRRVYYPGDVIEGRVDLHVGKSIRYRGFRVTATGTERTKIRVSTGKSSTTVREKHRFFEYPIILEGRDKIESPWELLTDGIDYMFHNKPYPVMAGYPISYDFSIPLPNEGLPSYSGKHAEIEYRINANLDLPLQRDIYTWRKIIVVIPHTEEDRGPTHLISQKKTTGFFLRGEIQLDLELYQTVYAPGDDIFGHLFIDNRSNKTIRGIDLKIVAKEYAQAKRHRRMKKLVEIKGRLEKMIDARQYDEIPFNPHLPPDAIPSYVGKYSKVEWSLEVKLDIPFTKDLIAQTGFVVKTI